MAEVRVQEGEPLENALRRFKRKVQQEDIIKEVKRHSYYLKPGEKKRVKAALARKRNRKKARKEAGLVFKTNRDMRRPGDSRIKMRAGSQRRKARPGRPVAILSFSFNALHADCVVVLSQSPGLPGRH